MLWEVLQLVTSCINMSTISCGLGGNWVLGLCWVCKHVSSCIIWTAKPWAGAKGTPSLEAWQQPWSLLWTAQTSPVCHAPAVARCCLSWHFTNPGLQHLICILRASTQLHRALPTAPMASEAAKPMPTSGHGPAFHARYFTRTLPAGAQPRVPNDLQAGDAKAICRIRQCLREPYSKSCLRAANYTPLWQGGFPLIS